MQLSGKPREKYEVVFGFFFFPSQCQVNPKDGWILGNPDVLPTLSVPGTADTRQQMENDHYSDPGTGSSCTAKRC